MLNGGRQLVAGEQEPAVAGDDEHLAIGSSAAWAPSPVAKPAPSVPAGPDDTNVRGPAEVEREVGGEADLGDVLDEHAVVGQHVADRGEVVELRPEVVDRRRGTRRGVRRARRCGRPDAPGRRARRRGPRQASRASAQMPIVVDAVTVELVGVDVDLDDRQIGVGAPVHDRPFHAAADAEHDVGVGPQVVSDRQRREQRMGGRDHAVTHPARRHRRLQQCRQGGDRVAGILRSAADDDQRPLGAYEERRRRVRWPRRRRVAGWRLDRRAPVRRAQTSGRPPPRWRPGAAGPTRRRRSKPGPGRRRSVGSTTSSTCLVSCVRIAVWSGSSCSTPQPRPCARVIGSRR